MFELFEAIALGMAILLPLANPLTTVALFLGLSGEMTQAERRHQSAMTSLYVFIILMVAWYAGQVVMSTFGISIPGLRIAGGLIVMTIGFRMLFPAPTRPAASRDAGPDNVGEPAEKPAANIAFVPLAMPSTAGPGTIAMIISSASTINDKGIFPDWIIWTAPPLIFALLSLILWLSLLSSNAIMRLVGTNGIDAISRLMGFLLVCMGVQFIINGVQEIVRNYPWA